MESIDKKNVSELTVIIFIFNTLQLFHEYQV
jgi:hypothetical protein